MDLVQNTFAELEISYPNCIHNYNYFRSKLNPSTKLLILIKANSYGHGAVEFAKVMEEAGADYFGVAHPIEGIELREGGIKNPIIILTSGTDHYRDIIKYNLEPGMPNLYSLRIFNSILEEMGIEEYPVHIKLDTGMHRLGFMENELPELLDFLKANKRIKVQSIYSHLAASDEPQHDEFTLGQIALYQKMAPQIDAVLDYKPIHHILNPAGQVAVQQRSFIDIKVPGHLSDRIHMRCCSGLFPFRHQGIAQAYFRSHTVRRDSLAVA